MLSDIWTNGHFSFTNSCFPVTEILQLLTHSLSRKVCVWRKRSLADSLHNSQTSKHSFNLQREIKHKGLKKHLKQSLRFQSHPVNITENTAQHTTAYCNVSTVIVTTVLRVDISLYILIRVIYKLLLHIYLQVLPFFKACNLCLPQMN